MAKNIERQNSKDNNENTVNKAGNKATTSNTNSSNSVGATRKYVSGDSEKSSSSHQFHKS